MLGIVCKENEKTAVKEFFQLFKTPWEFFRETSSYSAVISSVNINTEAKTVIIFSADILPMDTSHKSEAVSEKHPGYITFHDVTYPIYENLLSFRNNNSIDLFITDAKGTPANTEYDDNTGSSDTPANAGIIIQSPEKRIIRIGYNIFQETAYLLKTGQPVHNSLFPTLDIHITVVRFLLLSSGIPVIECPPVPAGYSFMAALTHDVDFIKIRHHFINKTLLGFLYRAGPGSLIEFIKGKKTFTQVLLNWKSILLLPFIYFGLCRDIWNKFEEYNRIEHPYRSTFYVMPYKNKPGTPMENRNFEKRATSYDVDDIKEEIRIMTEKGCEIGVHGINAWHDAREGIREIKRITDVSKSGEQCGVRIHWLCFDETSFKHLEDAGFYYDSTMGYNDGVGFRAGTLQVYCPLQVSRIKELPVHIQDTALFYPRRMNLNQKQAREYCQRLITDAGKLGGVLTILWHMRSISPERLWQSFYKELIKQLENNNVWIGTARSIVEWFDKRRALNFTKLTIDDKIIHLELGDEDFSIKPELEIRLYEPVSTGPDSIFPAKYRTIPLKKSSDIKRE